jgi:hypothetical protein
VNLSARITLRRITVTLLLLGWGVSWAAVSVIAPDLVGLPWAQIAVGVAISSWGGLTATLGRKLTAEYDNTPFKLRSEIVKDTAVSVSVGTGGYLTGAWQGLDPMLLGVVLLMCGYGGVKVLTTSLDRLLAVVRGSGGNKL